MDNSIPNISAEDIAKTKSLAWLSYLGFLFIVPMLVNKDSEYTKFHVNQGIVLFIFAIAVGIVCGILNWIPFVGGIISGVLGLLVTVCIILGVINAATGKVVRLPIIGGITIYK